MSKNCAIIVSFLWITQCLSMCPPLKAPKDTNLACMNPEYKQHLDCSASWLLTGTVASFRCFNVARKRMIKGRFVCMDSGVHELQGRLNVKLIGSENLPCNITEDKSAMEIHLYGYDVAGNYPLNDTFDDFHVLGLFLHNQFRKIHGSPPLQLLGNLSSLAQKWADNVAITGSLDLAAEAGIGQNIFLAKSSNISAAVNDAVQNWYYSGLAEYSWDDVTKNWNNPATLQFSQLIWKDSKYLGLGAAKMKKMHDRTVVVCFYNPTGNIVFDEDDLKSENSFSVNVKPKLT